MEEGQLHFQQRNPVQQSIEYQHVGTEKVAAHLSIQGGFDQGYPKSLDTYSDRRNRKWKDHSNHLVSVGSRPV